MFYAILKTQYVNKNNNNNKNTYRIEKTEKAPLLAKFI